MTYNLYFMHFTIQNVPNVEAILEHVGKYAYLIS